MAPRPDVMYVEARRRLVEWVRRQLIGPAGEGALGISPLVRYPTGVLHPVEPHVSGLDPASAGIEEAEPGLLDEPEDGAAAAEESKEGALAQPVRRRRYVPPSSAGFSFCVRGNEVRLAIIASAARYESSAARGEWGRFQRAGYTRLPLPEHALIWSSASPPGGSDQRIWEGRAGIDIRARVHREGLILTVTLCNRAELDPGVPPNERSRDRVDKALFEARIEYVIERGKLVEYPRVDPSLLSEEEQELELQYRAQHIYALGHGAAASWNVSPDGRARIRSDFLPEAEVPMMTVDVAGEEAVLDLECLAAMPMSDVLERFIAGYAEWAAGQEQEAAGLRSPVDRAAAVRIHHRMHVALERMRAGIEILRSEARAAEAFRLANRAMRDQMGQADRAAGKAAPERGYRWRPFQLAFLLTVLASVIREEDDYRDVLDLIWFPTGGGKTEAYLGLIAFLIAWRRLEYPRSGGGTAAFMRYTLRLLTRQQFERAARMMCALELIRMQNPGRLGDAPIDIGIWAGRELSPNSCDQARKIVEEIRGGHAEARRRLLLESCPWCGTPFDPHQGYCLADDGFRFHCADRACLFGADPRPLPCNVVDEALYHRPTSLLIGTIDKFARLAWEERAGAFFGADDGSRPPELIIQDELHLITGPLGSVAGLYEAGLETLIARRGVRPKYIASTATIRMAREQVWRLYARDLAVFPPPGLSHHDSYFAKEDQERPGRLYVGYLAPLLDQQHCLAPLAAALLAAPEAIFGRGPDRDALLDAWWTQVIYHGSLKGVGNSHNAFVTDVRGFGQQLDRELAEMRGAHAGEEGDSAAQDHRPAAPRRYESARLVQLTSRRTRRRTPGPFSAWRSLAGTPTASMRCSRPTWCPSASTLRASP